VRIGKLDPSAKIGQVGENHRLLRTAGKLDNAFKHSELLFGVKAMYLRPRFPECQELFSNLQGGRYAANCFGDCPKRISGYDQEKHGADDADDNGFHWCPFRVGECSQRYLGYRWQESRNYFAISGSLVARTFSQ
jgi:hypothetical protein